MYTKYNYGTFPIHRLNKKTGYYDVVWHIGNKSTVPNGWKLGYPPSNKA